MCVFVCVFADVNVCEAKQKMCIKQKSGNQNKNKNLWVFVCVQHNTTDLLLLSVCGFIGRQTLT